MLELKQAWKPATTVKTGKRRTLGIKGFGCAIAVVMMMSACGGSGGGGKKDSGGYKEPYGFLQATEKFSSVTVQDFYSSIGDEEKFFKKEETPAQKAILDRMMAGPDKKVARITQKLVYNYGWIILFFGEVSIDNGAKLNIKGERKVLTLTVNKKDFPDAGRPFKEYWIILDKNGNPARIVADRDSYAWSLELPRDRDRIRRNVLNSGKSWSNNVDIPEDVEQRVKELWKEGYYDDNE